MPFVVLAFLVAAMPEIGTNILTRTAEIRALESDQATLNGPSFRLQGQIIAKASPGFVLQDGTGGILINPSSNQTWSVGDVVEVAGSIRVSGLGVIFSNARTIRILHRGSPPEPALVQADDILNGDANFRHVRLKGVVYDVFQDEVDPRWSWFILISDGKKVAVALNDTLSPPLTRDKLVGCSVEVTGPCIPGNNGGRLFLGPRMEIQSFDDIRVLDTSPKDPFDVEAFHPNKNSPRMGTGRFDVRKKVSGTVLTTWGSGSFLLQAERHLTIRVKLRSRQHVPPFGTPVTVSGFVSKGSFFVTFLDALCRQDGPAANTPARPPKRLNGRDLFLDERGRTHFKNSLDGRLIQVVGTVRAHSNVGTPDQHMLLDVSGCDLRVEMGSLAAPPIGSNIEITGICMMTAEQDASGFDRIRAVSLIPRTADDIRIVSAPSWWTPVRSLMTIGALILLLVAILIWNTLLRKLAERRGLALAKSQIANATNALKVYERTRLAVELHDSLSQTLTGVSFEVNTAGDLVGKDDGKAQKHIGIAAKALDACRVELRNCLWDLRSQALEENDMNEAIRLTLGQDLGESHTSIRFNVARQIFTDNTAHAILRIIRELVTNAVRHGHAAHVRVAGTVDDRKVIFSVRDDGCGFDPQNAPGPREGHFGLDGIRERTERINGTITISSERGRGTEAVVTIPLPQPSKQEKS